MATGSDSRRLTFLPPSSSIGGRSTKYSEYGGDSVTVLVDGRRFTVNKSLFTKHPNTMLGRSVLKPHDYVVGDVLYCIYNTYIYNCVFIFTPCILQDLCINACRMFSSPMETPPNENGDYEILKGISADIFRAVIVRIITKVVHFP